MEESLVWQLIAERKKTNTCFNKPGNKTSRKKTNVYINKPEQ